MNKKLNNLNYSIWKDQFSIPKRIGIIIISYTTFFLVILLTAIFFIPNTSLILRLIISLSTLYLLPPLIARFIIKCFPIKFGVIKFSSNDFIKWWILLNLQIIFCRLPFLEEFLRIVPGIYGPWLRLWGSKIGRLTYWAAGLKILDRSFLNIGDDVIFGASVKLNAHVMYLNENNEPVLALDYITLGDKTIIGGYSILTAGCVIYPNQSPRAALILPPFTKFKDGKRVKE